MIRFSCPGCEATFNVGDEKAGKTGKCPKCSAQFTIPPAYDGQETAPPVPPVADGGAVEIDPCPKCGARLSVEAGDLGLEVECPTCRAVYPAEATNAARPRNPDAGGGKKLSLVKRDEVAEKPSRRREERDDEDDDRPSRRRSRDEDDEDDRPSHSRRRREDDDEDYRPRKKRKKKRRSSDIESKKLVAGLLAILLGGFGAHKFYLGYTTPGIIMLVLSCCTGIAVPIGIIEGIIYLTKSDEDFIETYQVGQKEWF